MSYPLNFRLLQDYGRHWAVCGIVAAALTGCAAPEPSAEMNDPFEGTNRAIHGFNKGLDRAVARPASKVYGAVLPQPVKAGVANFATNLDLPGFVLNDVLQGNPEDATRNTFRFLVNSTLGVGGLFDPAKSFGLDQQKTDFGETLHVWGAGEGAYLELPVMGPKTVRDATGDLVDFLTNPVSKVLPTPESYYATGAKVGSKLGDRSRYSETIDSVLYESVDSYSQTRLLYLQNRRFELGQQAAGGEDDFIDPYAE